MTKVVVAFASVKCQANLKCKLVSDKDALCHRSFSQSSRTESAEKATDTKISVTMC